MATNLVSQIIKALGPAIVSRLASSLEFDQSSAQEAIEERCPVFSLRLFSPSFPNHKEHTKLADVVAKQPQGVLSSLANVLGRSQPKRPS